MNWPEPYFAMRERKPADRAGHADRERAVARFLRVGLAVVVEKDVRVDRRRRGLAIIDGDVLARLREVQHHEAAAAEIAGARIGHRERKADRDGGIDRIAALGQDFDADPARCASCVTTMPCCATTACARASGARDDGFSRADPAPVNRSATGEKSNRSRIEHADPWPSAEPSFSRKQLARNAS